MDTLNMWNNINHALNSYVSMGYEYVNVPWIVNKATIRETLPEEYPYITVNENTNGLIGSAEQGVNSYQETPEGR